MVFNKRNIAAYFLSKFLIVSGKVKAVKAKADRGEFITSVYFHDPSKALFESCVKWFLQAGYRFLSTDEVADIVRNKKTIPAATVVFTADDGWRGNKENIAAVARKYKIPITIFASTQPVSSGEGYWWSYIAEGRKKGLVDKSVLAFKKLPDEERVQIVNELKQKVPLAREALTIAELTDISNDGVVSIGSHTVTHPILVTCSDQQSRFEITESKKILESWLQKEVSHFAYPNGSFNEREIEFLKESGYKTAYTTNAQYLTADNFGDVYSLPRFDVLEDVSFAENICRMTGAWFNKPSFNAKDK